MGRKPKSEKPIPAKKGQVVKVYMNKARIERPTGIGLYLYGIVTGIEFGRAIIKQIPEPEETPDKFLERSDVLIKGDFTLLTRKLTT